MAEIYRIYVFSIGIGYTPANVSGCDLERQDAYDFGLLIIYMPALYRNNTYELTYRRL